MSNFITTAPGTLVTQKCHSPFAKQERTHIKLKQNRESPEYPHTALWVTSDLNVNKHKENQ